MIKLSETYYVCGYCSKARKIEDVVCVSSSRFGIDDGFVAIRCKEHPNAHRRAYQSAWKHAKRIKEKVEG